MFDQVQGNAPRRTSGATPREIAGFELLEKIGQGGMGAVFKARQISMDRIVALKLLPPSVAQDQSFIERFQREARLAARLNHPNVVAGIDVGQDPQTHLWYFAMEFVEGPTLTDLLNEQKTFSETKALAIIRQIATALVCLVENGMVHRDIKPDNILLTATGEPKLADLGLARQTRDDSSLTQSGTALGTPHYMSPEQARGEVHDLDIRTDLYALGATLFHMLTGNPPFTGPTAAVIMIKHLRETAPQACQVNPAISDSTSRLIQRLMQKEKERRFQTPQELIVQIDRILAGSVTAKQARVRTTGPQAPILPPVRVAEAAAPPPPVRSMLPLLAGLGIGIVLLGVLGLVFLGGKPGAVEPARVHAGTSNSPATPPEVKAAMAGGGAADQGLRAKLDELLTSAREHEKAHPEAFLAAVQKYEAVIAQARGTPFESEYLAHAQDAAQRLTAQRQAAAGRAWKELERQAEGLLAAGDLDGAIRIFSELPPKEEDLLREKATAKATAIRAEGEQYLKPALEAAQEALKSGDPRKGLDALAKAEGIILAPFTEQVAELRKRLQDEAHETDLKKRRAQLALEQKLNEHLERFDGALIENNLAAAKKAAETARSDAALAPQCDAQTEAMSEMVKALEGLQRLEAAALKGLEGHEFTAGKDKGVVRKAEGGAITLDITLPGMAGDAKAQKTVKLTELSAEQYGAIFKGVEPPDTAAGKVVGAVAKLRQPGSDLAGVEELLKTVSDFPLTPHYAERVRIKRLGASEVAAEKAWPELEAVAKGLCTGPEQGKALHARLSAWLTAYGATKFAQSKKSLLDEWASKAARAQVSNLVLNGDFETGSLEPWRVGGFGGGSCTAVPEAAHGGKYGARLLGPAPHICLLLLERGVAEPLTPGEVCDVTFYYRFPSSERCAGRAMAAGRRLLDPQQGLMPAGTDWQLFSGTFFVRPNPQGELGFRIDLQGNVELHIDDIRIARRRSNAAAEELGVPAVAVPKAVPAEKQRVPAADAMAAAEKQVKEALKDEYAKRGPAERVALAQRLLKLADESRGDAAARYVALREAKDLAAAAGNYATASTAIGALSESFTVSDDELKQTAFTAAARTVTAPEDAERLLAAGLDLLAELSGEGSYDAALRLPASLDDLARKARNAEAAKTIQMRTREIRDQQAEWNRVKPMMEKLAAHPDDPDAALAVGRFQALAKGDWDKALPLLAKCASEGLKAAAAKELEGPKEAAAKADAGDLWWALAEKETGGMKVALQNRALMWYADAINELPDARKAPIEKRIQAAALGAGLGTTAALTYKEGPVRSIPLEQPPLRVLFHPNGRICLAACDRALLLIDLETGQKLRSFALTAPANSAAFSMDGRYVIASGEWGGVRGFEIAVWDVSSGVEVTRHKAGEVTVTSVSFAPDGRAFFMGMVNWQVGLYQLSDGKCLESNIRPSPRQQLWSSDGTVFMGMGNLHDGKNGRILQRFEPPAGAPNFGIGALSRDKRIAAYALQSREWRPFGLAIFDAASGRQTQSIQPQNEQRLPMAPFSLALGPDGRRVAGGFPDGVRVFDVVSAREVARWECRPNAMLDISPDGRFLVATGAGRSLRLFGMPR